MNGFVEVTTTDNTTTLLKVDQIAAIEEVHASKRAEGYLKIYVAGYSFGIKMDKAEFLKLIEGELK